MLQVLFTFPWYGCGVDSVSPAALEGVPCCWLPGETDKYKNETHGCLESTVNVLNQMTQQVGIGAFNPGLLVLVINYSLRSRYEWLAKESDDGMKHVQIDN